MTVALDAVTVFVAPDGNSTTTQAHTPVGTPRAAIVLLSAYLGSDRISSVSYGGIAMTEITGSPNLKTTGETGSVYGYFLGSGIPTGTQNVVVTAAFAAGNKPAMIVTLTGNDDTEVVTSDATIKSDSLENPSVTLSLGGRTCFCAITGHSGHDAVTSFSPLTGWTERQEHDEGTDTSLQYTYDTVGSTDVTAGWTQAAEDATMLAIAVSEVVTVAAGIPSLVMAPMFPAGYRH